MPPPRATLRSIAREPLAHFLALGAALFLLHRAVREPPRERIVVAAAFVDALREEQRARTGSLPDETETRGLIERFVDEEILYREALALGLDRGDLIVRRRLVQKMELLAQSSVPEPTEEELRAHLDAHPARYGARDTITLRHVFVSRDKHGDGSSTKAAELRTLLKGGADPATLGDPFVKGSVFTDRGRKDLESAMGASFAKEAFEAQVGDWSEPIQSSYGLHLVKVTARSSGETPKLADVRERVREAVVRGRQKSAHTAEIARLRGLYDIEIEAPSR